MKNRWTLATALAAGAGLMFLLDPQQGNRRRALVRDKLVRARTKGADAADATARDVRNRTYGVFARLRRRTRHASDSVLEARVRAQLGRVVSHPHAVRVTASDGRVRLEGPILASEIDRTLAAVQGVDGVRGVENALDARETPGHVPPLQGGETRPGTRVELMQASWSPTAKLLVATAAIGVAAASATLLGRRPAA